MCKIEIPPLYMVLKKQTKRLASHLTRSKLAFALLAPGNNAQKCRIHSGLNSEFIRTYKVSNNNKHLEFSEKVSDFLKKI